MTPLNNSTVAHDCVLSGTPPILIICSATTASLSGASREFVRELRSGGTRVEFHAPGDADALLQSANRLLAEIPLESPLGSAQSYPPHLLIIDDAESLSLAEAAALRRIETAWIAEGFPDAPRVDQLADEGDEGLGARKK